MQPTPEDSELQYDSVREVGVWTCYHAAHANAWSKYMQSNQSSMLRGLQEVPNGLNLCELLEQEQ